MLNNEGVGISSMSRILQIPKSSVQMLIIRAASKVVPPPCSNSGQEYEVDGLYTYIRNKSAGCYIIYAIDRKTREVTGFIIGNRSKENISNIIRLLLSLSPRRVYTDKLVTYRSLIPYNLHGTFQYMTNRIERMNLTLRTHLKRLTRRGICYSKSRVMLEASLKLYMWRCGSGI